MASRTLRSVIVVMAIAAVLSTAVSAQEQEAAPKPCGNATLQAYIQNKDGCTVGSLLFKVEDNPVAEGGAPDESKIMVEKNASPPGLKFTFPAFTVDANEDGSAGFSLTVSSPKQDITTSELAANLQDAILLKADYQFPTLKSNSSLELNGSTYSKISGMTPQPVPRLKATYRIYVQLSEQPQNIAKFSFTSTFALK